MIVGGMLPSPICNLLIIPILVPMFLPEIPGTMKVMRTPWIPAEAH